MTKESGSERPPVGKYIDLGLQFAAAVGLSVYGGWYLDNKLNTLPIFTLLGIVLGASAGFLNIYRTVYPPQKRKDSE